MLYHLPVSCTQPPLSPSWAQTLSHPSAPTSPSPGHVALPWQPIPHSRTASQGPHFPGSCYSSWQPQNQDKEINACFMTCPSLPLGVSFLFTPSPGSVTGLPGSEMPFPSIWGSEEGSGHWVQHGSFQSAVWSQQCDAPQGNCQPWRAAVLGSPLQHIPDPCPPSVPVTSLEWLCPPGPFQGQRGVRDTPAQQPLVFCGPGLGSLSGRSSHGPSLCCQTEIAFLTLPCKISVHPHPLHSTAAAWTHT